METTMRNYAKNMANTRLLKITSNLESKHKYKKQNILDEEAVNADEVLGTNYNQNFPSELHIDVLTGSVLISDKEELIYSNGYIDNEEMQTLTGKKLIARAIYTKSLKNIGWSRLYIETFDNTTPEVQSWAAGLLEGKLCAQEIWDFYRNLVGIHSSEMEYLKDVFEFYKKVEEFIRLKTNKNKLVELKEDDLKYWISVAMIQAQTDGLLSGYNSIMKNDQMNLAQLYFLNADGEVPELINVFKYQKKTKSNGYEFSFKEQNSESKSPKNFQKFSKEYLEFYYGTSDPEKVWNKFMLKSHCSAVIKLLKDENDNSIKDILIGHTTWDSYSEMHRIFKIYNFSFTIYGDNRKQSKIMFSSYAGTLTSTDDFYVLNNKLVILETTLEMIDQTIYEKDVLEPNGYVPNYIRISVSNRLADSAREWIECFKKNNSGTYNSQWMILDFSTFHINESQAKYTQGNKNSFFTEKTFSEYDSFFNYPPQTEEFSTAYLRNFQFKEKIRNKHNIPNDYKEIFFVLEQVPGYIEVRDMTEYLWENGFWASYNRPFFEKISSKAGYLEMTRLYGKTYSYDENPRAKLIQFKIGQVKCVEDLKNLMQNNRDIMESNFMNTVSPRYDLSISRELKRPAGGIDSKIVNINLVKSGKVHAISGPSRQGNAPAFDWKDWSQEPHYGLPQHWNFDWIVFDENFIKNKN